MNPEAHQPSSAAMAGDGSAPSYELLGKLAVGGMAELFLARAPMRDGSRGPVVVLKRILPHLAEDPEFVRMFRDEAYLAATLRHPNIVRVFDIGKHGDDYFFTMEYAHGENLRALLRATQKRGESIPLGHIITIALGVTAALHHAHEQVDHEGRPLQIVHRDVSPTNVIVGYDGSLKIVDFGIAKAAAGTHVTQAGMLKGKASYMSPEQCRSGQVDRRSDVFSIGILLYEMTTLTRLFRGDNELAILHQVLSGTVEAPSIRRPGYPPDLERIVLKALAQDADQRYQTAQDLQGDLMRFAAAHQLHPSPPGLSQFMRGLFGDKPLPWDVEEDEPVAASASASASMNITTSPVPGMGQVDETDLTRNRAGQTPGRQPAADAPPSPRAGASRRGPGARAAAPRQWRPGGHAQAPAAPPPRPATPPPAPPPGAVAPQPARRTGPRPTAPLRNASAKPRPPRPPRPAQPVAQSRPVAPPRPVAKAPIPSPAGFAPPVPSLTAGQHGVVTEVPPTGGAPRPVTPGHTPAQGSGVAQAGYSPPAPSYGIDPEESKTSLADSMLDAQKTQVAGTSAADIRKFIDAAPAPALGPQPGDDLAMKTQVAPTSAAEIQAFIAAAPPASFGGGPSPKLAEKTQVAPTSAAEMQAFVAGLAQPKVDEPKDLFATPSAPTRPAPPASTPAPAPPRRAAPVPVPAAAPAAAIPGPLPPPGGGPPRRDTMMKAPSQPAALGGPGQPMPPGGGPARPGATVTAASRAADDLEDAATVRMSMNEYQASLGAASNTVPSPVSPAPPHAGQPLGHPAAQAPPHPVAQAPIAQPPRGNWDGHPAVNQTAPMAVTHMDDEPLVIPGRRSKMIALIITLVGGVLLGGFVTWYFVLR